MPAVADSSVILCTPSAPDSPPGSNRNYNELPAASSNRSIGVHTYRTNNSRFSSASVPPTPAESTVSQIAALPTIPALTSIRYIFPNPHPPPVPPTQPQFIRGQGPLTKTIVCQEFVAIETENQNLRHEVENLQQRNDILRDYLMKTEKYHDPRYAAVMTRITELEAIVASGKGNDQAEKKEDEVEEILHEEAVDVKPLTSEAIANSNQFLVSFSVFAR